MVDSIMSEYEKAVAEFKKNCKETRYEKLREVAVKKSKKRRQEQIIRQTNMKLNNIFHEIPLKGYEGMKFKTPTRSTLTEAELNFLRWFDTTDDEETISIPDTVREEFNRFETNIVRLDQQYQVGVLTDAEYIAARQSLTRALEESRFYRDKDDGGTQLEFEPRRADTERPVSTERPPMGRIEGVDDGGEPSLNFPTY